MLMFLVKWLILSFAFWITASLLPGVRARTFGGSVWAAALFAVLNVVLGWLLFGVFTIGTLGLAYLLAFVTWWIIDALMLMLTDRLLERFEVDGFGWALGAAACIALFNALGHWGVEKFLV